MIVKRQTANVKGLANFPCSLMNFRRPKFFTDNCQNASLEIGRSFAVSRFTFYDSPIAFHSRQGEQPLEGYPPFAGYINPNSSCAASDIMLLSQAGVQVTATCTSFTPSIWRTF